MNFEFRNTQTQSLSSLQLQRLQILQFNMQELVQYIYAQYEQNVMLDIQHDIPEAAVCETGSVSSGAPSLTSESSATEAIEACAVAANQQFSLYRFLLDQLYRLDLSDALADCAQLLCGCLDDNGYLIEPLDLLCSEWHVEQQMLQQALAVVQSLSPPGVGARTLSECLSLQLRRAPGQNELAILIAENYLNEMALHQYKRIAGLCHTQYDLVVQACTAIKALHPYPGQDFATYQRPQYIIPDFILHTENGTLSLTCNNAYIPTLHYNEYYAGLLKSTDDHALHAYLQSKKDAACWVIRSIQQRQDMLLSCVEAIIELQHDFFLQQTDALRPCTISAMADHLQIHVSTLSRAIRNKYLQTDFGVYPLASFFSKEVAGDGTQKISRKMVGIEIMKLVQSENHSCPLTDQQISDTLKARGIAISRRTVTKYREQLGIFNAAVRMRRD